MGDNYFQALDIIPHKTTTLQRKEAHIFTFTPAFFWDNFLASVKGGGEQAGHRSLMCPGGR